MVQDGVWRPTWLTTEQLAERRADAAQFFPRVQNRRMRQIDVARTIAVSRESISRWFAEWRAGGVAALAPRTKTGRPPLLDAAIWQRLATILEQGAGAAGFDTDRWTLQRIADVAARELGVRTHFRSFSRILRAHGWTPQRPAVQAKERDEAVVRAWVTGDWAALTKELSTTAASWLFWTRTGHTFWARVGTTWAPQGHPPVLRRTCQRREVSSVVLLVEPTADRDARLLARHCIGTAEGPRSLDALAYFARQLDAPLLLVWDRLNTHRSAVSQAWLRAHDIANVFLPVYAPELNPEEQCNRHVKHAMLNAVPANLTALLSHARREFRRLGRRPTTLAHFFDHAGLLVTRPP
ncbi:MAG: IS630 family transposase [Gemmatimonadaceae bacterium]|jgi:transposase|nr:IS630 family transposase [Gemmatimonadaceae bacterium]